MSLPRTHVVDLGCMSRDDLIGIAKKQASQIREKNTRISAMEAFIESLTGASAEESLMQLPHANPTTSSHSSSKATPAAYSAGSGADTVATAYASELLQLQQAREEEQVQHTLRVSGLEEQLRERQREYDQLQAKVDAWKTKVMTAMTADQERIRGLEAQLAAATVAPHESSLSSAPFNTPFVVTAAPSPDTSESYMTVQLQQLRAQASALREELHNIREELQQAQSQLQAQQRSALQALSTSAAATVTTENLTGEQSAALLPLPSIFCEESPHRTLSAAPTPPTAADIPPEVLQEAVHAKLASWKEQAETAMLAAKARIRELEAQVAALGVVTNVDCVCRAEHAEETEALRAEVSRLQEALETTEKHQGDVADSIKAPEERMDAQKVRSEVENDELQCRTWDGEVQHLREDQTAGGAGGDASCADICHGKVDDEFGAAFASVERKEAWSQADVVAYISEDGTSLRPTACALQSVAVQTSVTVEAPLQVATDVSSALSRVALPELCTQSTEALLMENRRLQRVVADLSRFREEVMKEVRAVAASASALSS
ncbi:hypothetical protein, conserved [Leishmania tarentolae]|uniref:Uncharacterized protein n=1 Tax=Leishmania tarentolae TaxID=5689 RepID=A0A640KAN6_LEITA|nr:hypothetical protein, conserved [Leishmania tarentolae]